MSQAGHFYDGTVLADIELLTGNAGGAVGPDPITFNVNITGLLNSGIYVTGVPGTNTLNIAMYSPFYGVFEFSYLGAPTVISDILTLTNRANNVAMTSTGSSIRFNQWYFDAVTPAVAFSGRIQMATEGNWTSVAGTRNTVFYVSQAIAGVETLNLQLSSGGLLYLAPGQTRGGIFFGDIGTGMDRITGSTAVEAYTTNGHWYNFIIGSGNYMFARDRTTAPSSFVDIQLAGTVTGNLDLLELTNTANAAGMTNTSTSIKWNQWYFDGVTPAVADAGRISVSTEGNWLAGVGTRDGLMSFQTALDGTVAEKWRITSGGILSSAGAITDPFAASGIHVRGGTGANAPVQIWGASGGVGSFTTMLLNKTADTSGNFKFQTFLAGGGVSPEVQFSSFTSVANVRIVPDVGVATTVTDGLILQNPANANAMTGTGSGIKWNQYYYDAVTPALVDMAEIACYTEGNWTSVAGTRSAYMRFAVEYLGNLLERARIYPYGTFGINTSAVVPPANLKLHVNSIFNGEIARFGSANAQYEETLIGFGYRNCPDAYTPVMIGCNEELFTGVTTGAFIVKTRPDGSGDVAPTERLRVSSLGSVTAGYQPSFLAYQSGTVVNVTGNGATHTLGTTALTEVYDRQANFNVNGTFTAPTTGIYFLHANVSITGCTIATTFVINIVTTLRTYTNTYTRAAGATDQTLSITALADMTATNTATVTVTITGEAADTDDILGGASCVTYYCGHLVC